MIVWLVCGSGVEVCCREEMQSRITGGKLVSRVWLGGGWYTTGVNISPFIRSTMAGAKKSYNDFIDAYDGIVYGQLTKFETGVGTIHMGVDCFAGGADDTFYVYCVHVKNEFRKQSKFSSICRHAVKRHKGLAILAVGSFELDRILQSWKLCGAGFCNHGGDYVWHRDGKCPRESRETV